MLWLRRRLARIERRNLIVATLSVAITSIVMTGFLVESRWGYSKPDPVLIYADSWSADRSRAEAQAQQEQERAELKLEAARKASEQAKATTQQGSASPQL